MKRQAVLIFSMILISLTIFSYSGELDNSHEWSMQFRISENFSLSSFQGTNLSIAKNISDNSKIRFGINIDADLYNGKDNINDTEADINEYDISIDLQYLSYIKNREKIKSYIGTGPKLGYYKKYEYSHSNDIEKTTSQITVGLSGIFGIEYFILDRISLLSEYCSYLTYSIKNEITSESNNIEIDVDKRYIKFYPASVRFGISFYL